LIFIFTKYINRIIYRHEKFILLKGKKPVAELKPIPAGFTLGELPNVILKLPELSDKEASAFLSDLDEYRNISKKE